MTIFWEREMKLSQYNLVIDMPYGKMIYNLKTHKGFKLKNTLVGEMEHFNSLFNGDTPLLPEDNMVKELYKREFIVDDDRDEFQEVQEEVNKATTNSKSIQNIILHVTENCNFSCEYCFKKSHPQNFSDENWDNLLNYFEKFVEDENLYKSVRLTFYGGEPLLRSQKIIDFMKKANKVFEKNKEKSIDYNMITNGYLLSKDIYHQLVDLGLGFFMITLDGFAEQHNKSRPRVDGEGTWDKIVENLKYINTVEDEAVFLIRSNCNNKNIEIMDEFKAWVKSTFNPKKFSIDIVPVTKYSEMVDESLLMDCFSEEFLKVRHPQNYTKEEIFKFFTFMGLACKYAYGNFITISSLGKIFMCEESDEDDVYLADLVKEGIVYKQDLNKWLNRLVDDKCRKCILFPTCTARHCLRYKKCELAYDGLAKAIEKIKKHGIDLV